MNVSPEITELIRRALSEDGAWDDVTTAALIPTDLAAAGAIIAGEPGVVAGLDVAAAAFRLVDPAVEFAPLVRDGAAVAQDQALARVAGGAGAILRAERVALNFLQRLCGIATLTSRFVAAVRDLPRPPRIADTRKTTPGLRALEKYAVRVGGGYNHRAGLDSGVLVKDNHLALLRRQGLGLAGALSAARARLPHLLKVEVEASTLAEVEEALAAGADVVLLDNMDPALLARAVGLVGGRALTEASGGVNLANVRQVAETGVDVISIGALTHSAPALDVKLQIDG